MRTTGWIAAASLLLIGGVATTAEKDQKPVADLTQLMQAMVIPASNAIFDVARNAPADDAAWKKVERNAVLLGESGNLLLIRGRAKNTAEWQDSSRALIEAGEVVLAAVKRRDADAVVEAGNIIIDSCETCHLAHWDRSAD